MNNPDRNGLAAGIVAYGLWGLLPVFLKALSHVAAEDVLGFRVLSSFVLCGVMLVALRRTRMTLAALATPRTLGLLAISAMAIASNWMIYILAVNANHVLETSLGYFINPLLNVVIGVFMLGERLPRAGWLAIGLATLGVAVLTVENQSVPWVALGLACSFAIYGVVRKHVVIDPLSGLAIETLLLTPLALAWVLGWSQLDFGQDLTTDLLLAAAGPVTAVPLMLFAYAARRLPLSVLGLLQYLAPSLVFLLGVFVYHEPLDVPHVIAFVLIWSGLAIYVAAGIRQSRRSALAQAETLR